MRLRWVELFEQLFLILLNDMLDHIWYLLSMVDSLVSDNLVWAVATLWSLAWVDAFGFLCCSLGFVFFSIWAVSTRDIICWMNTFGFYLRLRLFLLLVFFIK
jgi:hypothetical protein